jgi:hypothetical protein
MTPSAKQSLVDMAPKYILEQVFITTSFLLFSLYLQQCCGFGSRKAKSFLKIMMLFAYVEGSPGAWILDI